MATGLSKWLWKVLGWVIVCLTNEIWLWQMAGQPETSHTVFIFIFYFKGHYLCKPASSTVRLSIFHNSVNMYKNFEIYSGSTFCCCCCFSRSLRTDFQNHQSYSRCRKFYFSLSSLNLNSKESVQIAAVTVNCVESMTFWEIITLVIVRNT